MKKWNTGSSCMPWMAFEMLSSFPRPYFCSRLLSWDEPQIPCQLESRSCFFSLIQPCHFTSQLPRIDTHLSGYHLNTKHFLERKKKKKEQQKTEGGMGQGFALPCCSRHICRGAPQSEPSCVCSGWRTEKSSSHTQSTGGKKKELS